MVGRLEEKKVSDTAHPRFALRAVRKRGQSIAAPVLGREMPVRFF